MNLIEKLRELEKRLRDPMFAELVGMNHIDANRILRLAEAAEALHDADSTLDATVAAANVRAIVRELREAKP